MTTQPSLDDVRFKDRFEAGVVKPADFHHRDHLRLVYVYLCDSDPQTANERMRVSLKKFLKENDVPASKFHETLTTSWVLAIKHFMAKAEPVASFDAFIATDDRLLDTNIMLNHYARDTLFSDQARGAFMQLDLQPIPLHVW